MTDNFEVLIDSFIANKVGIDEHFLSDKLAASLKQNLLQIIKADKLKDAGIGNTGLNINKALRSDKIYWLDKSNMNIAETDFYILIDAFVLLLNTTCFTGITGYEFHYSAYNEGAFYSKHIDQFQQNGSRAFSMIMYLNPDWVLADGGELQLYGEQAMQHIAPTNGKCVFFKSTEMPHEVLITNKPRYSITGWLKTGGIVEG